LNPVHGRAENIPRGKGRIQVEGDDRVQAITQTSGCRQSRSGLSVW
jgi:hypothetical protein